MILESSKNANTHLISVFCFYAEGPIHKPWIEMVEQHYSMQLMVEQAMKIFLFC
jgi:hypothetical protein